MGRWWRGGGGGGVGGVGAKGVVCVVLSNLIRHPPTHLAPQSRGRGKATHVSVLDDIIKEV